MISKGIQKKIILGILFFLPVMFLLMLYPSTNNYNALDVVHNNVKELTGFTTKNNQPITLKDHITVLGFLGSNPDDNALAALNVKEMIYDKFKGFKKFQIVYLVPNEAKDKMHNLEVELNQKEPLKFWYFAFADDESIENVFNSLKTETGLDENLGTSHVFIVDKELNQRGRFDDREDREKKTKEAFPLYSYDAVEVAELKNKMAAEDMRVLFTEYRQKRKGDFDTETRRKQDLKGLDNEEN